MPDTIPGPMCGFQLGVDWVDPGTMCRSRSNGPGSAGLSSSALTTSSRRDPFASIPLATARLVYSKAKEARWKRRFDEALAASGLQIAPTSGLYWRSLIGCLAASDSCPPADSLQFFLIRGGYEGFLARSLLHVDANRASWDSRADGTTDLNDAMVVLDSQGKFLGAFQLAVPNYYPRTAQMVARDWNGRSVFSYYNNTFGYHGLAVLDRGKLPAYDPKVGKYDYWIDIHHKGGTLGCIEIARSASADASDFDSFVFRLGRAFGRAVDEQYSREGHGYSLGTGASSGTFKVHMKHYLGTVSVLDIPS